ncbi:hypothetical protein GGR50DRAFT_673839 [Xylaria sp. CBS 124048]|nr:hypothetical protein GGR50DRAFT_673839 [Xylaria sp. CBS 124048]
MRFSNQGSMAIAMAASLASAAPHYATADSSSGHGSSDLSKGQGQGAGISAKPISVDIDLGVDLSGKVLAAGVLADVAVAPVAEAAAAAAVSVVCEECHVKGEIEASVSLEKLVPALTLDLKDVEVLLDLDVYIGAAATIAVNLVSPAKVSLPVPGLNVDALVYLDLVLGVHTELDLSAGVYVSLPSASIETDILNGNILDTEFTGVKVKVLPIKVRIGCTELLADLRLRVELAASAGVDANEVLPLDKLIPGLHVPTVGAGLEVAVYANILEYVGLFCAAPDCPLLKESYGVNVGAAVALDVAVEDLLSIQLAPTVVTTVLTIPTNNICVPAVYPPTKPTGIPGWDNLASTGVPTITAPAGSVPTPAVGGGNGEIYTITACAVNVANCPAGFQSTAVLTNTPLPTGGSISLPIATPTGAHDISSITSQVATLVPCASTSTFVAPPQFTTPPYPVGKAGQVISTPVSASAGKNDNDDKDGDDVTNSIPSVSAPVSAPTASSAPSLPVGGGSPSSGSYPVGSSDSQPAGGSDSYPTDDSSVSSRPKGSSSSGIIESP